MNSNNYLIIILISFFIIIFLNIYLYKQLHNILVRNKKIESITDNKNHDSITDNFMQIIKNKLKTKKYDPKILKYHNHHQHMIKDELIQVVMKKIEKQEARFPYRVGSEYHGTAAARTSDFNLHKLNIRVIDELILWITQAKMPSILDNFTNPTKHNDPETSHRGSVFLAESLKVGECWGIHFAENTSIIEHNHFPFVLSFIYYVSVPKNSGSIFINGEEHIPEEGQLIVFPANLYHYVKSNGNNLRIAIVGNMYFDFKENTNLRDRVNAAARAAMRGDEEERRLQAHAPQ